MLLFFLCVGDVHYFYCERFGSCDYDDTQCSLEDYCINGKTPNKIDRTKPGEWCDEICTYTKQTTSPNYTLITSTGKSFYYYCVNHLHVSPPRTPQLTSTVAQTFEPTPPRTYAAPPTCAKTKNKLKVQVVYALLN